MSLRTHSLVEAISSGFSAYIILNGPPIPLSHTSLIPLDTKSPIIVTDGAANSLPPSLVPTHIVGDFDSVLPATLAHYKALGVETVHKPCQDSHDFSKAMHVASSARRTSAPVLVLGGQPGAGRLDQFFGNVQELCVAAQGGLDVWWVGGGSACMVLGKGSHRVRVDAAREGLKCGLVPVAGPVESATTRGLKWNLSAQETKFGMGGLVSSSNEVVEGVVEIETSGLLLWTCDLKTAESRGEGGSGKA